jgi:hypothetical protein
MAISQLVFNIGQKRRATLNDKGRSSKSLRDVSEGMLFLRTFRSWSLVGCFAANGK